MEKEKKILNVLKSLAKYLPGFRRIIPSKFLYSDEKKWLNKSALTINDKIVCFSALQISDERWAKGIGRCSTRMWIHPDYRHGLSKFGGGDKFLNTTYCLPIQFNVAKLNNLDCLFISREHNLLAFNKYSELIKTNCSIDWMPIGWSPCCISPDRRLIACEQLKRYWSKRFTKVAS